MKNKQVVIELCISTDIKTLNKLFNEDGTPEEFEEWVQDDLDEMNVQRLLSVMNAYNEDSKGSINAEVTYVDIEED